ncbi:MAG: hypothetical protein ABEJ65_11210, partial [bacterium]
ARSSTRRAVGVLMIAEGQRNSISTVGASLTLTREWELVGDFIFLLRREFRLQLEQKEPGAGPVPRETAETKACITWPTWRGQDLTGTAN